MIKRVVGVALALLALSGCSFSQPESGRAGKVLKVVAAENFWGNIASQLGGNKVDVQSIFTDPNADPHDFESNINTARAVAQADLVIINGAGYDAWAEKLLQANPSSHRQVFIVADLLGKKEGDNPHFWYNPPWVMAVSQEITRRFKDLDPSQQGYFEQQQAAFVTAMQPYQSLIADIQAKFAGTKVGSTESIFVYLAQALKLDLISPPEFMNAVAEGSDPPVAAVANFQNQVAQRQIKVMVYNTQTVTEVTTNLKHQAVQQNIPVVGISETLQPPTTSFQQWQLSQLSALEKALNAST